MVTVMGSIQQDAVPLAECRLITKPLAQRVDTFGTGFRSRESEMSHRIAAVSRPLPTNVIHCLRCIYAVKAVGKDVETPSFCDLHGDVRDQNKPLTSKFMFSITNEVCSSRAAS